MNKIQLIIISALVLLIALSSCKKLENEIAGSWNIMTFDTKTEGTMQITFDEDSTAIRVLQTENGQYIDSCNYEIAKGGVKQKLIFRNSSMLPGCDNINGTYRVDKISHEIIVATRTELEDGKESGAFYRLELKRKN